MRLFIDQDGNKFWAKNVKDLKRQVRGSCVRMMRDRKDGTTIHVGYVIGQQWLVEFAPVEKVV